MDLVNASMDGATNVEEMAMEGNPAEADGYKRQVDELSVKVEQVSIRSFYDGLSTLRSGCNDVVFFCISAFSLNFLMFSVQVN